MVGLHRAAAGKLAYNENPIRTLQHGNKIFCGAVDVRIGQNHHRRSWGQVVYLGFPGLPTSLQR